MNWHMVDKDMVAEHGDLIFRIRHEPIGTDRELKPLGYALQLRKKKNTKFEYLGYHFMTEYFYERARPKIRSIDDKVWNEKDLEAIANRAEEILIGLGFELPLEDSDTSEEMYYPILRTGILRLAVDTFMSVVSENKLIPKLTDVQQNGFENALIRAFSVLGNRDLSSYVTDHGSLREDKAKDFQAMFEHCLEIHKFKGVV